MLLLVLQRKLESYSCLVLSLFVSHLLSVTQLLSTIYTKTTEFSRNYTKVKQHTKTKKERLASYTSAYIRDEMARQHGYGNIFPRRAHEPATAVDSHPLGWQLLHAAIVRESTDYTHTDTHTNSTVSRSLEIEAGGRRGQTATFVPTGRAFAASKIVGPGLPRLVSSHAPGAEKVKDGQGRESSLGSMESSEG